LDCESRTRDRACLSRAVSSARPVQANPTAMTLNWSILSRLDFQAAPHTGRSCRLLHVSQPHKQDNGTAASLSPKGTKSVLS
jgi:hypothetical protein